jgi:hypothetical protein
VTSRGPGGDQRRLIIEELAERRHVAVDHGVGCAPEATDGIVALIGQSLYVADESRP